jgi:hypothetical protein
MATIFNKMVLKLANTFVLAFISCSFGATAARIELIRISDNSFEGTIGDLIEGGAKDQMLKRRGAPNFVVCISYPTVGDSRRARFCNQADSSIAEELSSLEYTFNSDDQWTLNKSKNSALKDANKKIKLELSSSDEEWNACIQSKKVACVRSFELDIESLKPEASNDLRSLLALMSEAPMFDEDKQSLDVLLHRVLLKDKDIASSNKPIGSLFQIIPTSDQKSKHNRPAIRQILSPALSSRVAKVENSVTATEQMSLAFNIKTARLFDKLFAKTPFEPIIRTVHFNIRTYSDDFLEEWTWAPGFYTINEDFYSKLCFAYDPNHPVVSVIATNAEKTMHHFSNDEQLVTLQLAFSKEFTKDELSAAKPETVEVAEKYLVLINEIIAADESATQTKEEAHILTKPSLSGTKTITADLAKDTILICAAFKPSAFSSILVGGAPVGPQFDEYTLEKLSDKFTELPGQKLTTESGITFFMDKVEEAAYVCTNGLSTYFVLLNEEKSLSQSKIVSDGEIPEHRIRI